MKFKSTPRRSVFNMFQACFILVFFLFSFQTEAIGIDQLPADDFSNNSIDDMWYLSENNNVWMSEVNQRLEGRSAGGNSENDAAYISEQWKLSTSYDFSMQIDWHFSVTAPNAGLFFGVAENLLRETSFTLNVARDENTPDFYIDAYRSGEEVYEINDSDHNDIHRENSDGVFYISYDSMNDRFYLSTNGYWRSRNPEDGDWVFENWLKGEWGLESVSVVIGVYDADNIGNAIDSGDAYFDNFLVTQGTTITVPYNHVVAFGDSLSDHDGLSSYNSTIVANGGQGAPGSWTNNGATPYGGEVWLDYLTDQWGATLDNNAIGGAMTLGHESSGVQSLIDASLLPDLGLTGQVATYLASSPDYNAEETLFTIWIGGNDCLEFFRGEYYTVDPSVLVADSIGRIITQMDSLYADGARNFMVMNLPDLAKTPAFNTKDATTQANVTGVVMTFNAVLASALSDFTSAHGDANIYNIDAFTYLNEIIIDDVFDESVAPYLNVDGSCNWDFTSFNGTFDMFLFFDCIHPTTSAHELVAMEVAEGLIDIVSSTGNISGVVTTKLFGQSVNVAGATVTVSGTQVSTVTDAAGNYTLADVPPGTHDLEIMMEHFAPVTVSGVIVTAGATTPVSTDDTILTLSYGFSQAELDAAILAEQQRWDANGDGQIGLEEAIRSLQIVSGIE